MEYKSWRRCCCQTSAANSTTSATHDANQYALGCDPSGRQEEKRMECWQQHCNHGRSKGTRRCWCAIRGCRNTTSAGWIRYEVHGESAKTAEGANQDDDNKKGNEWPEAKQEEKGRIARVGIWKVVNGVVYFSPSVGVDGATAGSRIKAESHLFLKHAHHDLMLWEHMSLPAYWLFFSPPIRSHRFLSNRGPNLITDCTSHILRMTRERTLFETDYTRSAAR
mmetsp:Transcript_19924/g.56428  ORF Transcript_19924/g.56428 Transcript_19924/m.56428 type:complete len:222 (-) Transcript_19924:1532-2197(-)